MNILCDLTLDKLTDNDFLIIFTFENDYILKGDIYQDIHLVSQVLNICEDPDQRTIFINKSKHSKMSTNS